MNHSEDATWILGVLSQLRSPDADLVRELLEHMARLRTAHTESLLSVAGLPGIPQRLPLDLPESGTSQKQDIELLRRRAAIYSRLRKGWNKVRDLPPCLQQCRLLKETSFFCIHAEIATDPLVEGEVALSLEQAREYGHRALDIAEQLGDLAEVAEICHVLAFHYKLCTEYDKSMSYTNKALALAEKTGNLHIQHLIYAHKDELLSLMKGDVSAHIQNNRCMLDTAQKRGDLDNVCAARHFLARLLVLAGDNQAGAAELGQLSELLERHSQNLEKVNLIYLFYHLTWSLLYYKQGDLAAAIHSAKNAIRRNLEGPHCREDYLWPDLSWLEMLCRRSGEEQEFRAFCQEMRCLGQASRLEQWFLLPSRPDPVVWDEEEDFSGNPCANHWRWIDPLQKGEYTVAHSLEITPIMGTGIYSNVYVPRLMQEVEENFTIETVLDYREDLTRAGGILVYQDDNTLIRYGAGIHFDGELTLTIKSPEQGFFVVGRGLLTARQLTLRLAREGNCFKAWCSDGKRWYRCGQAMIEMRERIEVGLFAECTYRHLSLVRCTATPVRFTAARLRTGNRS